MSVQLFGRLPRRLLDRGVQAALGRGAHFQFLPETPDPSAGNSYQLTPTVPRPMQFFFRVAIRIQSSQWSNFLSLKPLDPKWIRIGIQPKMLDPDPSQLNTDPQPCFFLKLRFHHFGGGGGGGLESRHIKYFWWWSFLNKLERG